MSWVAIATKLAARIQAVCKDHATPARTHRFQRWSNDHVDNPDFQQLFVAAERLSAWQLTRIKRSCIRAAEDSRRRIQHEARADYWLAISDADESEMLAQAMLDAVCDDLETGDRTLGGVCLTHTEPEVTINAATVAGVLVHTGTLRLTIEEVL